MVFVQHVMQLQVKAYKTLNDMLTPRLINYPECSTIPALLNDIDCKLKQLAGNLYNNVVFILNQPVPAGAILDLLNYKRILTYKFCNPNYAKMYTVEMIASRVKLLISK
jgi:hypothetical protein